MFFHKRFLLASLFIIPIFISLLLVNVHNLAIAAFGTWGDTSLVHACKDSRGRIAIVGSSDTCNQNETQITWLKDVDAGSGLTATRNSNGVTLSLASSANDGWIVSSDTWNYASANSFTISGVDRTTVFSPGTRVKFTNNGSTKYGVVASSTFSANTTVNLIANSDYSIDNSAITASYYSYEAIPQGYPGWFNYTPTLGGITVGNGSVIGKFNVLGNGTIAVTFVFSAGSTSSYSGNYTMTMPVPTANITNYRPSGQAYQRFGGNGAVGVILAPEDNTSTFNFEHYASNGINAWSSSQPFGGGATTNITANIVYQF